MKHEKLKFAKQDLKGGTSKHTSAHRACAVRMEMKQGALTHKHQHEGECLMVVLEGALRISVPGQTITVRANEMLHIPPQQEHSTEAIADSVALSISTSSEGEWSVCGPFLHDDPDQYLWGV